MGKPQSWPRCSTLDALAKRICGSAAIARTLGDPTRHEVDYYCCAHAPVAHEELQEDWFLPTVRVTIELEIGATTNRRLEAETEAAAAVLDALRSVGLEGSARSARFKWAERPAPRLPRVPARSWARGRVRPVKPNSILRLSRGSR